MKIVKLFFISLIPFIFASCSNMTIGLEEESRFYNGPLYDNREDIQTKDKVSTSSNQNESINSDKELKTSVPTPEIKEISSKNETTFSYERDEE